jgi:hypothetical protein
VVSACRNYPMAFCAFSASADQRPWITVLSPSSLTSTMVSRALVNASSKVSPAEKQPGKSGTTTPYACFSSPVSIAMGYCIDWKPHHWLRHVQSGTSLQKPMELGGWKSYEMVLRYANLAPEKLSFVAGRIERQPLRSAGEALRGENVAKKRYVAATVAALRFVSS